MKYKNIYVSINQLSETKSKKNNKIIGKNIKNSIGKNIIDFL
ncbi:hypothetical protein [Apilactobacillus micheneri]|nr:hypothetical protein [Apilactobacillus micheneri]